MAIRTVKNAVEKQNVMVPLFVLKHNWGSDGPAIGLHMDHTMQMRQLR